MSQAVTKRTPMDDAAEAELARWPDVTWSRSVRGKHYQLVLAFQGQTRFVIYSATPSDSFRGAENHLRDLRGQLRLLGAERVVVAKTAAGARRKRNVTQPARMVIQARDPGRVDQDPWAALRGFQAVPPTPELRRLMPWLFGLWRAVQAEREASA